MGKSSIKFINFFNNISNNISRRYIIGNKYFMFNTSKYKIDFAAVSRAVKSPIAILEDIQNNVNSRHLQNFQKEDKTIHKLSSIEMHTTVSGTTRKKRKIDTVASTNGFHKKVIELFITALVAKISKAFNLSELLVLQLC